MTLARRLAAVEAGLSPTELVVRWLDEAHAYRDLTSYVRSLLDAEPVEPPLDRLCREAVQGARARVRGRRPEIVDAAIASALREVAFRFELVMRINVTTHELLEREVFIEAALSAHVGLLTGEDDEERRLDTTYAERFARLRDLLLFQVTELRAAGEARTIVEARYLAGHPALFPDAVAAWDQQLENTELLAALAVRLAELDGVPAAARPDPDAASARVTELVADLVEPAKALALEKLGETQRASSLAMSWMRSLLLTRRGPEYF